MVRFPYAGLVKGGLMLFPELPPRLFLGVGCGFLSWRGDLVEILAIVLGDVVDHTVGAVDRFHVTQCLANGLSVTVLICRVRTAAHKANQGCNNYSQKALRHVLSPVKEAGALWGLSRRSPNKPRQDCISWAWRLRMGVSGQE